MRSELPFPISSGRKDTGTIEVLNCWGVGVGFPSAKQLLPQPGTNGTLCLQAARGESRGVGAGVSPVVVSSALRLREVKGLRLPALPSEGSWHVQH